MTMPADLDTPDPGANRPGRPGTDALLLAEALERMRSRLTAFVRVHVDATVRAHESCSDIVQSVCREVLANRDRITFQGDEAFRAWLFTWALNKIRDRQCHWLAQKRDVRREQPVADGSVHDALVHYQTFATPSREAMLHEQVERIEAAFDRLPPQYREVISLARIAGLSHAEIAAQLGSTPGAVRTQLNRALVRLATELDAVGSNGAVRTPPLS